MVRTTRPRPAALNVRRSSPWPPLLALLAGLAVAVAAMPARSAVPQTIAFQGFLTDDGGLPINGTVNLEVAIFAAASGGTALWSETHGAVEVDKGVFAVALGSVTPFNGAVAHTSPRFLAVTVDGGPPLPRTELRAAPFALRAQAADSVTAAIGIRSGNASVLRSTVDSQGQVNVNWFTSGGILLARVGADTAGDGEMVLFNDDHTASMSLDTGATGDTSVRLPTGSINANETASEPGVASANNTGFTALTSTPASVLTRTISAPAAGFVIALGQAVARIDHTSGTATSGAVGLSDDGVSFGTAQDVNVIIPSTAPSGAYGIPVHVNGVFGAGNTSSTTVHLLGSETSGDIELEDVSLTLIYVPTSYGTVSATLKAVDDGERAPARGPLTPAEIAAEQEESRRADLDRLEGELAAMRRELTALLAEVEQRLAQDDDPHRP